MLKVEGLSKSFPSAQGRKVVFENFHIETRQPSIGLFGPNGCGKTTLLQMICGLVKPDSGKILVCGKEPRDCRFAYVFQSTEGFVFPWLDNLDNITLPLKLQGQKKKDRLRLARNIMEDLGVEVSLDAFPYQLSGGQKQIVMLLRALVDPATDVLLLDEPFLNLDYLNSLKILKGISRLLSLRKMLVVFVSHTIEEALALSNSIFVLAGPPTSVIDEIPVPPGAFDDEGAVISEDYLNIRERVRRAFDCRKDAVSQV